VNKTLCTCLLTGLFLQSSAQAHQDPDETSAKANNEIPFELRDGFLLVVQGRIAQHKDLKFVLDTGATYSVVNRRLAERLSARRRTGRVLNFNRTVTVEFAEFSEVQFGPVDVHNASLIISDLVDSSHSDDVDAVIGLDLLRLSKGLCIDYASRKIIFRQISTNRADVLTQHASPFLFMQVMLQGQPAKLLVDTGMKGILLYEDRLRKRLPSIKLDGELRGVRLGYLLVTQVKFAGISLGNREAERTVFLMKGPSEGFTNIDGYLGTSALNARQVELDFEENTIAWRE